MCISVCVFDSCVNQLSELQTKFWQSVSRFIEGCLLVSFFVYTQQKRSRAKKKEKKIHIGTKAMLQFIHIFRLTHKNIVQYHSYFRGHLQNQLSARGHLRLHLRLCVCGLEFPVTETIRPTSLFCFGVFFCQGHMTAIWPHWWPINHAVRLYKAAE